MIDPCGVTGSLRNSLICPGCNRGTLLASEPVALPDELPSHSDIARWVSEMPASILDRLPPGPAREEARRMAAMAANQAHYALENGVR